MKEPIDTGVNGPGLRHLQGLSRLRVLNLGGAPLTDAVAEGLPFLDSVETLFLADTPLTDKGLEGVRGLTKLKGLHLWRTRISERGRFAPRATIATRPYSVLNASTMRLVSRYA